MIESKGFVIFMTILTFYALFGDDIRQIFFSKSSDIIFYYFTGFALVAFLFEFILASYSKPKYIWGFFFWLDLISTITLVMDIGPF
jgi:hypothetical protein